MSFKAGFDAQALERVESSLREDVERGLIDGAVIKVARHGEVVLDAAIGYADRHAAVPMREDSVFKVLSLTKAFTTTLILEAIDLGLLSLTTRVVDVIPEFWGRDLFRSGRKERVNVGHLLTHRAGLSPTPQPLPYDRLHVLSETIQAICDLDVVGEPGKAFSYSPTVNHALLGEMVRRVHGADSLADLLDKRLFSRLGMASTSLGPIPQTAQRRVPLTSNYPDGGWLTNADIKAVADAIETPGSQMPWVGAMTSAPDVFAFAEMLRQNGTGNGERVLSPAVIRKATTLQTGNAINDLYKLLADMRHWDVPPGNMGLGYALGGDGLTVSQFGTLTSPGTYGNFGAGSTLFWVDPESQITFVCLTAKVMEESENILRFQRLSDLVASAAL
ncbi:MULTISPECIES: serine hydrolase [unclassified Pseudomonas]|uniref:serine hydrolase domain-containing protein n=1 Tax=unclassified Pseudomonas TaxID=196821 RepID=UPI000C87E5CD|nr:MULTISPECIES: serine hydrolase domain-containing protein [unclassified Pseudomonas]PMX27628.1 serine hydrolase [Pseudomonas sp. GW460-12]PMX35571.1 serine hydrolase [Pseudomonas sp. MPR-R2A4]PMX42220.1 serine hydrolase [Pseudomonas sp. MPR-R2A7]PMX53706.1 serine hydrolase [Pseudomonas sp. MPR-R2A6]PMX90626.1 serine hydrolase [Pseudomonas sp. MPR-R2A3]